MSMIGIDTTRISRASMNSMKIRIGSAGLGHGPVPSVIVCVTVQEPFGYYIHEESPLYRFIVRAGR